MSKYKQCTLTKGNVKQTTFLPAQYGLGEVVSLRDKKGIWDDGWTIIQAGEVVEKDTKEEDYMGEDYRVNDKGTFDSIKKWEKEILRGVKGEKKLDELVKGKFYI